METWVAKELCELVCAGFPAHPDRIGIFGHSMGGACLLMAAHRNPALFRRIVAFEPIVFPPTEYLADDSANDGEGW